MSGRRETRSVRCTAALVAAALMLAACGGPSGTDATDATTPSVAESTGTGSESIGAPSSADIERALPFATKLIATFDGDDVAAFDALMYALNNGYDPNQVAAAINDETLGADGRIEDVEPNLVAPDLLTPQGQGFAQLRGAEDEPAKLPIEELRDEAYRLGGEQDEYAVGAWAILFVLTVFMTGFTLEQIVEYLVFGSISRPDDNNPPVAPATDPPTSDAVLAEPDEVDTTEGGSTVYVATVSSSLGSADEATAVFTDEMRVVAGDTLSGSIDLLADGPFVGDSACFYISIQFSDVAMSGVDAYEGAATVNGAIADGNCPGGRPPPTEPLGDLPLTATISGDAISVSIVNEGESTTFIAQRQS